MCPHSYFDNITDLYCDQINKLAEESINEAINEEVTSALLQADNEDNYRGISILSDARHGWRKNAKQSDIVALGMDTHKVVGAITVTHDDDPVSQRHELIGAKRL